MKTVQFLVKKKKSAAIGDPMPKKCQGCGGLRWLLKGYSLDSTSSHSPKKVKSKLTHGL